MQRFNLNFFITNKNWHKSLTFTCQQRLKSSFQERQKQTFPFLLLLPFFCFHKAIQQACFLGQYLLRKYFQKPKAPSVHLYLSKGSPSFLSAFLLTFTAWFFWSCWQLNFYVQCLWCYRGNFCQACVSETSQEGSWEPLCRLLSFLSSFVL